MRWWRRRRTDNDDKRDAQDARDARRDSERRLRQVRRDWPDVNRTRDELAAWIESALRGRGV